MKKILPIALLLLLCLQNISAQSNSKIEVNSTTSFGTLIPIGSYGSESANGFSTTFGIELKTKKNIVGKLNIEASRVDFNSSFESKGINYKIKDKTDIINLTAQLGYKKNVFKKKVILYALGGGGVSIVNAPKANFNFEDKILTSENLSEKYFVLQSTFGAEYKISKTLALYSEVTYSKIISTTFLSSNKVNFINFQIIGFKMAF